MEMICLWAPSSAVGSGRNLMLGNKGIYSSWVPVLQTPLTLFDPQVNCFPSCSPFLCKWLWLPPTPSPSYHSLSIGHLLSPRPPSSSWAKKAVAAHLQVAPAQVVRRPPFPGRPCPVPPSLLLWQYQTVWPRGLLATTGIPGCVFRAATRWWGATASQPSGNNFFFFFLKVPKSVAV